MTMPITVATIQFHGMEAGPAGGTSAEPSRAAASDEAADGSPATVVGTRIGNVVAVGALELVEGAGVACREAVLGPGAGADVVGGAVGGGRSLVQVVGGSDR